MPIYEYCCHSCQHSFELLQKFTDEPARNCPECGHTNVEKLISQSQFHLKGSGWYKTDYQKPAGKETQSSANSSATEQTSSANNSKPAEAAAVSDTA